MTLNFGWIWKVNGVLCFMFRSRMFHSHRDSTIAGEWLQHLDLSSASIKQLGSRNLDRYCAPHTLWHGASVYTVSSEGWSHFIKSCFTTSQGYWPLAWGSILARTWMDVDILTLFQCWNFNAELATLFDFVSTLSTDIVYIVIINWYCKYLYIRLNHLHS